MVSISRERDLLKSIGICDYRLREDWGARRSYTDSRNVIEPATRVFVHISVTNPGAYSSFDAHARAIESIGINRFPNTGISYNRLIQAGTLLVYEGQPIGRRGAHTVNNKEISPCSWFGSQCPGYGESLTAPNWNLNYNARAYVYCANTWHSFDDNSLDTMARAIAADKLAGFVTKNAAIHGHRCVAFKSCPGDNVWDRMHELEGLVNLYLQGEEVALNKNETTDAVWDSDRIPAPSRYGAKDTNPNWLGSRFVRELVNYIKFPRNNDPLVEIIKDPIIDRLNDLSRQVESVEIRLVELQQNTGEERRTEHLELQEQLAAIQSRVNLLIRSRFLPWNELGEWNTLGEWNSLLKADSELVEAAYAGANQALSEANLEVSWEDQ